MDEIIGQVRVVYNNEEILLDVHRDGSVLLPDGVTTKVNDDVLNILLAAHEPKNVGADTDDSRPLPAVRDADGEENAENAQAVSAKAPSPADNSDANECKESNSANESDTDTNSARQNVPKGKGDGRQKGSSLYSSPLFKVLGCVLAALLILVSFIVYRNWPQIKGQITNSYNVATVNRDVARGEVITSNDISFKTMTGAEYATQCNNFVLDTATGKTIPDAPVFYVNSGRDIANKFATTDLTSGTILTKGSISAQKTTKDVYNVESTDADGNKTVSTTDAANISGKVTVAYVAIITTADGQESQIPLSTITMVDKGISDILDVNGKSIFEAAPSVPTGEH